MRGLLGDRRGATAIEYSLIVSFIFLAIFGAMAGTGNSVSENWKAMGAKIVEAMQQ